MKGLLILATVFAHKLIFFLNFRETLGENFSLGRGVGVGCGVGCSLGWGVG